MTDDEAFQQATVVFSATLLDIRKAVELDSSGAPISYYMYGVDSVFKGQVLSKQAIATPQEGGGCGLPISVGGGPFLVFAYQAPQGQGAGTLNSGLCSGTRLIRDGAVPEAFGSGSPPTAIVAPVPVPATASADERSIGTLLVPVITVTVGALGAGLIARRRHRGVSRAHEE